MRKSLNILTNKITVPKYVNINVYKFTPRIISLQIAVHWSVLSHDLSRPKNLLHKDFQV